MFVKLGNIIRTFGFIKISKRLSFPEINSPHGVGSFECYSPGNRQTRSPQTGKK